VKWLTTDKTKSRRRFRAKPPRRKGFFRQDLRD